MEIPKGSIREISKDVSVLYVEGDMLLLTQVNIFMTKYFSNIDTADNGEAALILYKQRRHDLIISDLKLPKLNGLNLIKEIKKINPRQHIVVTTKVESPNVLRALINMGIDRIISKPFDFNSFFKYIYKAVTFIHHQKVESFYRDKAEKFSQMYQEVVDQLKIGIVLMELKKIILVNKEFLKITGFSSLEKFNDTLDNLTGIFWENDLKMLNNEGFIDILMEKRFLEVTVVHRFKNTKTELIAEITQLSDFNKFLITFLNVEFLENHIKKLRRKFFKSEFSGLPNIFAFKEKFDIFKAEKTDINLLLFSIKNFKSIRLYFGVELSKKIFLDIVNEMIDIIKHKNLDNKVSIFDFGINQIVFAGDTNNLRSLETVFIELKEKKFYESITNNSQEIVKKVPVNFKIATYSMILDKTKTSGEILMDISDKFYELYTSGYNN